ncbi:Geranylgeranyl pyrophosphate synthetase [Pseudonocardia sp. Ae168_Ps1]|nr:Geranylgeranyl pyrophosphate synthetase [Pseudonocardia sp. Ae168_Ps1]OLL77203.1 Geranylgeranyl pyrophosphate synthetase [Pseudonocardia sp. Ae150A_Ps1]OLL88689.1 Geranylgeranyl pyrophosphate synthetase [Pseudonocardia sp. Ae263_Ps1]OLL91290.1 Geranylgeranyl pyrophosphate synthetase [Pseudonocardia sp. Ae356_Ps1]
MVDPAAPASVPSGRAEVTPAGATPLDDALPQHVERVLAGYLDRRRTDVLGVDPAVAQAADALAGFVLGGGKRLRPTFAWWGWRGAGGDPGSDHAQAVLTAVASLELIQACALVHDDLMDASSTRRGRPTVHVEFARTHAANDWSGPPARFGAAVAILVGDLAQVWADDMFHSAALPDGAHGRAAEPWRAMRTEVLAGQYLDVLAQASGDTAESTALQIDRFKTAAYTVERPLHLGAAIAGAEPQVVNAYRRYGADIGVAFQLRDDLLGVFGAPRVTGKPAGDDLREGKRTLLVAAGLQRAEQRGDPAAREAITAALGDPGLPDDALDRARSALAELGAVQAVEQRIAALTGSALDALDAAPVAEPGRAHLFELAERATRRAW